MARTETGTEEEGKKRTETSTETRITMSSNAVEGT